MRNGSMQFRCEDVHLRVENTASAFTSLCSAGDVLRVPISHGEGRYYADNATLDELESTGRVAFRYCSADGAITPDANPNGSLRNIAGIVNVRGNVLGMMPHPERTSEALLGGTDGLVLWRSVIETGVAAVRV
jgi:phosphoribosylformylglycinamidine synthase